MEVFADVVFYQQQNRRKKSIFKSAPQCQCVWDTCGGIQHVSVVVSTAGYFWIFRVSGLRLFVCAHHCVCVSVCSPFLALDELLAYWWKKLIKENKCLDLARCHTSTPLKHSTSMHRQSRARTHTRTPSRTPSRSHSRASSSDKLGQCSCHSLSEYHCFCPATVSSLWNSRVG